jgi:FkbM family methyltransferase
MPPLRERIRRIVKRLARAAGFELRRTSHGIELMRVGRVGVNPFVDVRAALGIPGVQTIFDVGANRGQSALECAQYFPESVIYSFEPDPTTCDILRSVACTLPQVRVYCHGFGAEEARAKLFLARQSEGNSLLRLSQERPESVHGGWTSPAGEVDVMIRRLDCFCDEEAISGIDLLKIDTQGYELNVLEGCGHMLSPDKVRSIFLEVAFRPIYDQQASFEDVYRTLISKGYHLIDFYHQAHGRDARLIWCDALFA